MLKYTALITQSIDCASARSGEGSSTPSTFALCAPPVRPSPPGASRETCRGVPFRPQLLSSAVFSCLLHRRVIRTQGMQAKGTVLGSHTHTPAPTARGWQTPTAHPVGGQSGEGQRLTSDAPSQWCGAPPPGTPFRNPHSEQRWPARAHAVGLVLGPHARTDRTRDTPVAEPRPPASEDGRQGEGQRLTPDAPRNSCRPTPPGTAPNHPRGTNPHRASRPRGQCWAPTPTHPRPQHVGGGPQQPAQWAGRRGRDSA